MSAKQADHIRRQWQNPDYRAKMLAVLQQASQNMIRPYPKYPRPKPQPRDERGQFLYHFSKMKRHV
jgi:hypothetical protein